MGVGIHNGGHHAPDGSKAALTVILRLDVPAADPGPRRSSSWATSSGRCRWASSWPGSRWHGPASVGSGRIGGHQCAACHGSPPGAGGRACWTSPRAPCRCSSPSGRRDPGRFGALDRRGRCLRGMAVGVPALPRRPRVAATSGRHGTLAIWGRASSRCPCSLGIIYITRFVSLGSLTGHGVRGAREPGVRRPRLAGRRLAAVQRRRHRHRLDGPRGQYRATACGHRTTARYAGR